MADFVRVDAVCGQCSKTIWMERMDGVDVWDRWYAYGYGPWDLNLAGDIRTPVWVCGMWTVEGTARHHRPMPDLTDAKEVLAWLTS